VSLWDDGKHVGVEVELPGVTHEDIDLSFHERYLHIVAERKAPDSPREYWYDERRYGRIERNVNLPDAVDADSINAELHDGVLQVTLAKKPEAQAKQITVNAD
jgi:HSP20 family protein